jgi:hypothetical protein
MLWNLMECYGILWNVYECIRVHGLYTVRPPRQCACIEPELRASHPKAVRFIAFNALYIASFMLLMFTATRRHVAKDPR